MMIYTKISTWFLALSMFMFGTLKFINPFKKWYMVQIANSNLGELSYLMGIMGEITVGIILILCLVFKNTISKKMYLSINNLAFATIVLMMLTGVYVHLHPNVPADVLPLKIKAPYIPIFFLLLALSNILLSIRQYRKDR